MATKTPAKKTTPTLKSYFKQAEKLCKEALETQPPPLDATISCKAPLALISNTYEKGLYSSATIVFRQDDVKDVNLEGGIRSVEIYEKDGLTIDTFDNVRFNVMHGSWIWVSLHKDVLCSSKIASPLSNCLVRTHYNGRHKVINIHKAVAPLLPIDTGKPYLQIVSDNGAQFLATAAVISVSSRPETPVKDDPKPKGYPPSYVDTCERCGCHIEMTTEIGRDTMDKMPCVMCGGSTSPSATCCMSKDQTIPVRFLAEGRITQVRNRVVAPYPITLLRCTGCDSTYWRADLPCSPDAFTYLAK